MTNGADATGKGKGARYAVQDIYSIERTGGAGADFSVGNGSILKKVEYGFCTVYTNLSEVYDWFLKLTLKL